jgi:hypothetical protein
MNPGRRGGKPATNRLSYGAAFTSRKAAGSILDEVIWFYD